MATSYILGESEAETRRLRLQAQRDDLERRLEWAGLRQGMHVVDAGCGPGEQSRVIARRVGPAGRVVGFDGSEARIQAARAAGPVEGGAPIEFHVDDLLAPTQVPPGQADFVFCQFVFEYLADPKAALHSLIRLLKPGGTLLVCDIDGVQGNNWPEPPEIAEGSRRIFAALARTGFDRDVGRKLFHYCVTAGLENVDADLHVRKIVGAAPPDELDNWRQRFEGLAPLGIQEFGSEDAYRQFAASFLDMIADETGLKYHVLVSVRGTRPR